MYKLFIVFALSLATFFTSAANIYDLTESEPLSFKEAFSFTERSDGSKLIIEVNAVKGHYLYTESVDVKIGNVSINSNQISFGPTETKNDEFYGVSEVIVGDSTIEIELNSARSTGVKMTIQGCSSQGLCYMPQKYDFQFTGSQEEKVQSNPIAEEKNDATNILFYFVIGLLIAFTPCTYPLTAITLNAFGKNKVVSAAAYVSGLTLAFTSIGMLVVTFGATVLPLINSNALNTVISIVFLLLGVSLLLDRSISFGGGLSTKITSMTNNSGDFARSFTLGIASGVLLTPCTSAPLFAALIELTTINITTHSIAALVMISLGLSAPLVAVAAVGNKLLVKPGLWMETVKNILAGLIIGYAITMVYEYDFTNTPLTTTELLIWSASVVIALLALAITKAKSNKFIIAAATAVFFIIGSSSLNANGKDERSNALTTNAQLSTGLSIVKVQAEWCTNCKTNTKLINTLDLKETNLYEVDITEISEFEEQYLNENNIIGVPTTHFYKNGELIGTHVGIISKEDIQSALKTEIEEKHLPSELK